jgi:hypothetical protein
MQERGTRSWAEEHLRIAAQGPMLKSAWGRLWVPSARFLELGREL